MFDVKAKRFWVLFSTVDMAMKFMAESKDGFGMSMQTCKNTGMVFLDFTYKICQEQHPVFVRKSRAQTLTLTLTLTPTPTLNPNPNPTPNPNPNPPLCSSIQSLT